MNYVSKESLWFPVEIHTRDINGMRKIHRIADISQVCKYIEEDIVNPEEEEILMVMVCHTCVYSGLGSDPITWDDITGFFA